MTTNMSTSRAKSMSSFSIKKQPKQQGITKQSFISSLLQNRRSSSIKKIFTDETTYTYKPQRNNLPFELYPDTRSQIQISKEKIFERLIDNMKEKQENFKLIKLQKEEKEFQEKCSFRPELNECTKKIIMDKLKNQKGQKYINTFQKLYEEGCRKLETKQKQYSSSQQQKLTQQHTFKPQINPTSKAILNQQSRNLEPIFKRFQQQLKKKRQNLKTMQQQQQKQLQEKANFKINNKKTIQILQNKENYNSQKSNVVKRLLEDYFKQKETKLNERVIQQEQKLKQQCTFRPKTNGDFLLVNTSGYNNQLDFLERQKQHEDQVKENIFNKANQLAPSFRPQINKLSELICKERQYQSLDDKLNRLNFEPLFQKQAKLQELQKSLYKECKFHPQINEISRALTGGQKPHTCNCHPKPQKYNFQPIINQKSRQLVANKHKHSKTAPQESQQNIQINKKQHLIQKLKMQKQYKQLVECTFRPKTTQLNKAQLKMKENVTNLVEGVRKFVDKRNDAIRKKKEEQQYKDKIFNLEKRYKPKKYTKPQEFKLSAKQFSGKNYAKLVQQAEEKFQKQHPFKPNVQFLR